MNTSDRAFIKAYHETETQSQDQAVSSTRRIDPPVTSVRTNRVPSPHLNLIGNGMLSMESILPTPAAADSALLDQGAVLDKGTDEIPSSEQQPASEQPVAEVTVPAGPHFPPEALAMDLSFSPQWEVDRFRWPSISRRLATECRSELENTCHKMFQRAEEGPNVFLVSHVHPQVGCTTFTLATIQTIVSLGKKVALVDANFAKPELASRLGMTVESGWEKILEGGHSRPEHSAVLSLEDRFVMLPLGRPVKEMDVDLLAESVTEVLQSLSSRFDIVLVDAGEVPEDDSVQTWWSTGMCEKMASAIIVQGESQPLTDQVAQAVWRFRGAGIHLLGVIDNFVRRHAST